MQLSDERISQLTYEALERKGVNRFGAACLAVERAIRAAVAEALAPWKAWERTWIFGGDAEWPGEEGTTDPRNAVEQMDQAIAEIVAEAVAAEREAILEIVDYYNTDCQECGVTYNIDKDIRARSEESE